MNQCAIQQSCIVRSRLEEQERRNSITATSMLFSVDSNHHHNRPTTMNNLVCPKPRRVSLLNGSFNNNNNDPCRRTLPWPNSYQSEMSEKAGSELLNLILSSRGCSDDNYNNNVQVVAAVASSSPFFIGSPPSRVSNPLTQDAVFMEGNGANHNNFLHFSTAAAAANTTIGPPLSTTKPGACGGGSGVCGTDQFGGPRGSPGGAAAITVNPSSDPTSPAAATPSYYYSPNSGGSARKGSSGCVRGNFGNNPAVRIEGFDCLDRDRSRNSCSIATLA